MMDPSQQANDIMQNTTNIFKAKKKRRVTFQNESSSSPPKQPGLLPNFIFDDDDEEDAMMQETQLIHNNENRVAVDASNMEETRLINDPTMDLMQETQLITSNHENTNMAMEETQLITNNHDMNSSQLMDQTQLLPTTNTSMIESTDLLTKQLNNKTGAGSTFNLDEYIQLHHKQVEPLHHTTLEPMPSHFLNSLMSEDMTSLAAVPASGGGVKPIVDTSTFFKQVETTTLDAETHDDHSPVHEDVSRISDMSLLNSTPPSPPPPPPKNNDDNQNLTPTLCFPVLTPTVQQPLTASTVVKKETTSDIIDALLSQYTTAIITTQPDQSHLASLYQSDFNQLLQCQLRIDFNESTDESELLYLINMINKCKEYCTLHCHSLWLSEVVLRADGQSTHVAEGIKVYQQLKQQASVFINELVEQEQELDVKTSQQQQELQMMDHSMTQQKTELMTFERDVTMKIAELDGELDAQEQCILQLNAKIETLKYEIQQAFLVAQQFGEQIKGLEQQNDTLQFVQSSDVDALIQQQEVVYELWGWRIIRITDLEMEMGFKEVFRVKLEYLQQYTSDTIDEVCHVMVNATVFDDPLILQELKQWIVADVKQHMDNGINVKELLMELTWTLRGAEMLLMHIRYISRFYPTMIQQAENGIALQIRNDDMQLQVYQLSGLRRRKIKIQQTSQNELTEMECDLKELQGLFVQ